MTIGRQKLSEYDKRIERAKYLAAEYSFAAKPLKFYEQITQFQQGLFATLVKEWGKAAVTLSGGPFRAELNLAVLLPQYSSFLALVEAHAPKPLGAAATDARRRMMFLQMCIGVLGTKQGLEHNTRVDSAQLVSDEMICQDADARSSA